MSKEFKPEKVVLQGYVVIYDKNIKHGKDKENISVEVTISIDGELFTTKRTMWQWQASEYLKKFGSEL